MSSTDRATPDDRPYTRPHVLAQLVADDADHLRQSKVRVHSALASGRRIVAIEICGAVTFQTCIADPSEVAVVLREWADEIDRQAADTGRVTPADAEHLLALLANAEADGVASCSHTFNYGWAHPWDTEEIWTRRCTQCGEAEVLGAARQWRPASQGERSAIEDAHEAVVAAFEADEQEAEQQEDATLREAAEQEYREVSR